MKRVTIGGENCRVRELIATSARSYVPGASVKPNGKLTWQSKPLFRKRVSTGRGELTFTSVTALDHENRQLLISERHELNEHGRKRISEYQFVMRCWERAEIELLLARHGFGDIRWFGAYDPNVPIGSTNRLVVVAC